MPKKNESVLKRQFWSSTVQDRNSRAFQRYQGTSSTVYSHLIYCRRFLFYPSWEQPMRKFTKYNGFSKGKQNSQYPIHKGANSNWYRQASSLAAWRRQFSRLKIYDKISEG